MAVTPDLGVAKRFGDNLRRLRISRKLKLTEFAAKLDVNEKTLQAYEIATRIPNLRILDVIQREFDVDASQWLIPDGASYSDDVSKSIPTANDVPSLVARIFHRSEQWKRWSDDVLHLSTAIPEETISAKIIQLEKQGLKHYKLHKGIDGLVSVAEENGFQISKISVRWNENQRAAAFSNESIEPDLLFVNTDAPIEIQREDLGECLVTQLLGLRPQACRTWANKETKVTRWHATGMEIFGYGLDEKDWGHLTIDSFAKHPDRESPCIAYKVVHAMLAESPTWEQKMIRAHTRWPITRIERLYHKDGSSFIGGITITDTQGVDETRLLVTVTNLQVPALAKRLTREVLVQTAYLENLLMSGGASIPVLADAACCSEAFIRQRLADTGYWSRIYNGEEMMSQCVEASNERAQRRERALTQWKTKSVIIDG